MNNIKLDNYKKSLEKNHRALNSLIKEAYISRVDDETLREMKTQKLALKGKIVDLDRQLAEENNAT